MWSGLVSMEDARQKLAKFRKHYNEQRPHTRWRTGRPPRLPRCTWGKLVTWGARNPRQIRRIGLLKVKMSSFVWCRKTGRVILNRFHDPVRTFRESLLYDLCLSGESCTLDAARPRYAA